MRAFHIVWLATFAFATSLAAAKIEPLEFPSEIAADSRPVAELLTESNRLNTWAGGYPPRIKDEQQRREVYREWKSVLAAARALHARDGDTEQTLLLLGRLYRQGHNLNVKECGEKAIETLDRALAEFPDSEPLNFEASYLFLSINPKFAPRGEAALKKLRQLRGTERDLEIERGFIFAYLYQNRIEEAKRQVEHCLTLAPRDKMLLQFRAALQKQKSIEVREGPPPHSGK